MNRLFRQLLGHAQPVTKSSPSPPSTADVQHALQEQYMKQILSLATRQADLYGQGLLQKGIASQSSSGYAQAINEQYRLYSKLMKPAKSIDPAIEELWAKFDEGADKPVQFNPARVSGVSMSATAFRSTPLQGYVIVDGSAP